MPEITDPAARSEERIDFGTLRVTRRSTSTGRLHTMDLPIEAWEWERFHEGRLLIQEALPRLTNPQREFLLTGTTQEEWEALFPPEDDEDQFGYLAATEEVIRRDRADRGEPEL